MKNVFGLPWSKFFLLTGITSMLVFSIQLYINNFILGTSTFTGLAYLISLFMIGEKNIDDVNY